VLAIGSVSRAFARTYSGALPWESFDGSPPAMARPGPSRFFTHDEARVIEAIVDRLSPRDELGVGGKDAGCADFIDRQLRGPFGDSRHLYMRPPFAKADIEQAPQSPVVPAQRYRAGLAALDACCRQNFSGQDFASLAAAQQDDVLRSLEAGRAPNAESNRLSSSCCCKTPWTGTQTAWCSPHWPRHARSIRRTGPVKAATGHFGFGRVIGRVGSEGENARLASASWSTQADDNRSP
jgi:hypothetical protein